MDSGLFRGPWNSVPCVPAHFNHWPHGHPQDFFQGWAMRGSEGRKSPSRVQGQLPSGSLGATDDIFSKWCINTSSTEALDNSCSKKNTFQHFQGRGAMPPPPPCPFLRRPWLAVLAITAVIVVVVVVVVFHVADLTLITCRRQDLTTCLCSSEFFNFVYIWLWFLFCNKHVRFSVADLRFIVRTSIRFRILIVYHKPADPGWHTVKYNVNSCICNVASASPSRLTVVFSKMKSSRPKSKCRQFAVTGTNRTADETKV